MDLEIKCVDIGNNLIINVWYKENNFKGLYLIYVCGSFNLFICSYCVYI